jgi:hypothetical protein
LAASSFNDDKIISPEPPNEKDVHIYNPVLPALISSVTCTINLPSAAKSPFT